MMPEPLDPGPLTLDDPYFSKIVALDFVDGSSDAPDDGMIAFMHDDRPKWPGYAAWIVEASNAHRRKERSQMGEFDYHMREWRWFVALALSALRGAAAASFVWSVL